MKAGMISSTDVAITAKISKQACNLTNAWDSLLHTAMMLRCGDACHYGATGLQSLQVSCLYHAQTVPLAASSEVA